MLPAFLQTKLYADFRDDVAFEAKYAELLRNIHGQPVTPRPQLGPNPFTHEIPDIEPLTEYSPARYVSPALSGKVTFDYSNNNGRYVLGTGDMLFETAWSRASSSSIHAFSYPASIRNLTLATGVSEIAKISGACFFDTSSRVRDPHLNEILIWQNTAGYYLATKILVLKLRGHADGIDQITFIYCIEPNKSGDFTHL